MASTVAIVGNGFDLNLGMPTSYLDFLRSPYFPASQDEQSLSSVLCRMSEIERWVDIELELVRYSAENPGRPTFQSEYNALRSALGEYIKSLPVPGLDGTTPAHRLIQKLATSPDPLVVNFNYTSSIRKLLEQAGMDSDTLSKSHWSIHGTCVDQNTIFGVDDLSPISVNHPFLYKSFAPNFSARGLSRQLIGATEVHFFGHSLGPPDHMYFRSYFQHLAATHTDATVTFHYYGESGRIDLLSQVRALCGSRVAEVRSNAHVVMEDVSA